MIVKWERGGRLTDVVAEDFTVTFGTAFAKTFSAFTATYSTRCQSSSKENKGSKRDKRIKDNKE